MVQPLVWTLTCRPPRKPRRFSANPVTNRRTFPHWHGRTFRLSTRASANRPLPISAFDCSS
jgi:hypothetical protein